MNRWLAGRPVLHSYLSGFHLQAATSLPPLGSRGDVWPYNALGMALHAWLFPRAGAVVHHGGTGTPATGLRVGKLGVIVPIFEDQAFWNDRMHSIKAGSAPASQEKLKPGPCGMPYPRLLTPPRYASKQRSLASRSAQNTAPASRLS